MEHSLGTHRSAVSQHEFGQLSVDSLSISLRGRQLICGLSLEVGPGEVVGLLGRDGAGKTSCFEALAGLLKVGAGTIHLNGQDLTGRTFEQRARLGLSYLPEETSVFSGLTVNENILMALELSEHSAPARASQLESLLNDFQLRDVRHQLTATLSGGERRRCEIARAMATHPTIMLLDEPFKGLDPTAIASTKEAIAKLKVKEVGVLVSDYDLRDLIDVMDRAYVIDHGRAIFSGDIPHLLADLAVRHFYLGESFSL